VPFRFAVHDFLPGVAQLFSLGIIWQIMKYTFTFIALTLLLTGCSRRDAKLSHQIAGSWQGGPARWSFNSDGSFSTGDSRGTNGTSIYGGTWQIQNGILTMVLTNTSGPKAGIVGTKMTLKIVSVDAHHITYDVRGHTTTMNR